MTDIRGIIFDKDGTLFDFTRTWGSWTRRVIEDLAAAGELARRLDHLEALATASFPKGAPPTNHTKTNGRPSPAPSRRKRGISGTAACDSALSRQTSSNHHARIAIPVRPSFPDRPRPASSQRTVARASGVSSWAGP